MVGLNFSDEGEADKFLRAMETKIKDRQQRRQSKTCFFLLIIALLLLLFILALKQRKDNTFNRPAPSSPPSNPAPPLPTTPQPRSSPLQTIPEPSHSINTPSSSSSVSSSNKKGKRKKISKSDISGPSNFQWVKCFCYHSFVIFVFRHLAHVGWDPNTGAFDVSHYIYWCKKLHFTHVE